MTEGITSETRKKISKQKIIIKHKERRTSTSKEMQQEKKKEKRKPTKASRKKEKRKKDVEGGETQENGNSHTGKKSRRDFCSDLMIMLKNGKIESKMDPGSSIRIYRPTRFIIAWMYK